MIDELCIQYCLLLTARLSLPFLATALAARMFGVWTLLASVVRLTFAISMYSTG